MARKWRINLAYDSNDSKWLKTIPRPPGSDSVNDNDQSVVGGGNEAGSVLVTAEKQLELKRKQVMVIINITLNAHKHLHHSYSYTSLTGNGI